MVRIEKSVPRVIAEEQICPSVLHTYGRFFSLYTIKYRRTNLTIGTSGHSELPSTTLTNIVIRDFVVTNFKE